MINIEGFCYLYLLLFYLDLDRDPELDLELLLFDRLCFLSLLESDRDEVDLLRLLLRCFFFLS